MNISHQSVPLDILRFNQKDNFQITQMSKDLEVLRANVNKLQNTENLNTQIQSFQNEVNVLKTKMEYFESEGVNSSKILEIKDKLDIWETEWKNIKEQDLDPIIQNTKKLSEELKEIQTNLQLITSENIEINGDMKNINTLCFWWCNLYQFEICHVV